MTHWLRNTAPYLPMPPVAIFNLPMYKTTGGLKAPTGRQVKWAHVMIAPMVIRDLSTPKLVERMSGTWWPAQNTNLSFKHEQSSTGCTLDLAVCLLKPEQNTHSSLENTHSSITCAQDLVVYLVK